MTEKSPSSVSPFVPPSWLKNGHAMTLYAWAKRRSFPELPAPERRLFKVADDTTVAADCYWQQDRAARPVLLALHGLESSSDAHYMRGLASQALRRGWNAVLLNQRNCGGTERLTPGLYHSGLTADPVAVMRELVDKDGIRDIGVVGYSLGGNLSIKLAGELGRQRVIACPRGSRRKPDDRPRRVRARDRAPRQRRVPVEFCAQPARPHAPKSRGVARRIRSGAARPHMDDSRVRRAVHRAISRIRWSH
jgi:pimeloyl-ACP methyl ester carboxylesterase